MAVCSGITFLHMNGAVLGHRCKNDLIPCGEGTCWRASGEMLCLVGGIVSNSASVLPRETQGCAKPSPLSPFSAPGDCHLSQTQEVHHSLPRVLVTATDLDSIERGLDNSRRVPSTAISHDGCVLLPPGAKEYDKCLFHFWAFQRQPMATVENKMLWWDFSQILPGFLCKYPSEKPLGMS